MVARTYSLLLRERYDGRKKRRIDGDNEVEDRKTRQKAGGESQRGGGGEGRKDFLKY